MFCIGIWRRALFVLTANRDDDGGRFREKKILPIWYYYYYYYCISRFLRFYFILSLYSYVGCFFATQSRILFIARPPVPKCTTLWWRRSAAAASSSEIFLVSSRHSQFCARFAFALLMVAAFLFLASRDANLLSPARWPHFPTCRRRPWRSLAAAGWLASCSSTYIHGQPSHLLAANAAVAAILQMHLRGVNLSRWSSNNSQTY